MQIKKWVMLLIMLPLISGCSSYVHKRFLESLYQDRLDTDGSFPSLVAKLEYNDKRQLLAVGRESGSIEVWDINKSRSKIDIKAHEYPANMITFASDGVTFFSGSTFERSAKIWNARTGKFLHKIRDMRGPVGATPDSDIFVIANGEQLRLFNLSRKSLLPGKYASSGTVTSMATDASSRLIAIGTENGFIEIWKYTESGKTEALEKVSSVRPYSSGDWVVGLQFSEDGSSLYSVARFGTIYEWDPGTLEKRRAVPTVLKHIYSTDFYREKNMLVLAGTEKMIGPGPSTVEVISLTRNESRVYQVETNLARVEILPPLSAFVMVQGRTVNAFELPFRK